MYWPLKILTHSVQILTIIIIIWVLVKRHNERPYSIFIKGWSLVLGFDLSMVGIGLIKPVTNHWLYNIALPLQHLLVIWFFTSIVGLKYFRWLISIFLTFAVINLFFIQGTVTLNTYTLAVAGLFTIVVAIVRLYELYLQDTTESVFSDPDFWYCTGFILYGGLSTPYFAMYNYLWHNFTGFTTVYFYTFNFGFAILLNLCIIKAVLCQLTPKRSLSSLSLPI
jgi:hypothetical protein